MQVRLEIVKGVKRDRDKSPFEISGDGPDNITIGRSARKSEKYGDKYPHIQISSQDLRLSRWHFMVQMRPPNCYVYDIGSTNHTYVNDFKPEHYIKETAELKDGDVVKAGRTHLKVYISEEKPKEPAIYHCVICGKELKGLEGRDQEKIGAKDFICKECKQKRWSGWLKKEEEKKKEKQGRPRKKEKRPEKAQKPAREEPVEKEMGVSKGFEAKCFNCGRDMTGQAARGERAEELKDVALYLCKQCAGKERTGREKVGDYLVLSQIGKGGMGVVYKAWYKPSGMVVVIKELLPDKLMNEKSLKVFHREISITHDLIHPNIVRFYDSFSRKGKPYLITEYLPGGNAEESLLAQSKAFSTDKACRIILQILEGLSYAHERGIVHRDLKPPNFLFDKDGRAKLSDMGLAKSFEQAGQSGITSPNEIGGTPLFMAPEQILDFCFVKPPADLYSVGVCLYYFLTGKFPFHFPSRLDALMGLMEMKEVKNPFKIVLEEEPIPILDRKPDLPKALADAIDKCLKKKPEDRFGNARELKEAIKGAIY